MNYLDGERGPRMTLYFVDYAGEIGVITDDFTCQYDGDLNVEVHVTEIREAAQSDEQAIEDLIAKLPETTAIREVSMYRSRLSVSE